MNKVLSKSLNLSLSSALIFGSVLVATSPAPAGASSHREAPLISSDPQADNTDTYAFVSPDRPDSVTLIASYIPFEAPEGGPNFYKFGDEVAYDINVDPVGDTIAHIKYRFQFSSQLQNPNTFLYNTGPITAIDSPNFNQRQYYTVTEIITQSGVSTSTVLIASKLMPPVNIGDKSTPNYPALSDAGIYTAGSGADQIKIFAGQTDDPFWVDLGSVFDLLSLRPQAPPIGYPTPKGPTTGIDGLSGYNVHSIVVQVPTAHLLHYATVPTETVIGVWATASRPSVRTVGSLNSVSFSGLQVQVSRLGMPLVNEVVMPLALKDAFNSIPPSTDYPLATSNTPAGNLLLTSVLTPELQTLLKGLYGVPNPGKPRSDIFDIFLKGMVTAQQYPIITAGGTVTLPVGYNVNRPGSPSAQPGEMIRLNTAIKGNLCSPTPNYKLGLLGGDACGFPNGRRLQDDVTEMELLAVAGAAWQPLTNDTSFNFNPALIKVLNDGVDHNDVPFRSTFPYLAYAHQGQEHNRSALTRNWFTIVARDSKQ